MKKGLLIFAALAPAVCTSSPSYAGHSGEQVLDEEFAIADVDPNRGAAFWVGARDHWKCETTFFHTPGGNEKAFAIFEWLPTYCDPSVECADPAPGRWVQIMGASSRVRSPAQECRKLPGGRTGRWYLVTAWSREGSPGAEQAWRQASIEAVSPMPSVHWTGGVAGYKFKDGTNGVGELAMRRGTCDPVMDP